MVESSSTVILNGRFVQTIHELHQRFENLIIYLGMLVGKAVP